MRNFTAGASDIIPETPRAIIAEPTGLTYNKKPTKQSRASSVLQEYYPELYSHGHIVIHWILLKGFHKGKSITAKSFITNCDTDPNIALLHTDLNSHLWVCEWGCAPEWMQNWRTLVRSRPRCPCRNGRAESSLKTWREETGKSATRWNEIQTSVITSVIVLLIRLDLIGIWYLFTWVTWH